MFENENLLILGHPHLRNTHMAIKFSIKSSNLVFEPATVNAINIYGVVQEWGIHQNCDFSTWANDDNSWAKKGYSIFRPTKIYQPEHHVLEDQSAESCYRSSGGSQAEDAPLTPSPTELRRPSERGPWPWRKARWPRPDQLSCGWPNGTLQLWQTQGTPTENPWLTQGKWSTFMGLSTSMLTYWKNLTIDCMPLPTSFLLIPKSVVSALVPTWIVARCGSGPRCVARKAFAFDGRPIDHDRHWK